METNSNYVYKYDPESGFKVLEEPPLPPVNEFRRFCRVFFRRKIVVVGFVIMVVSILCAIFADFVAPYGPNEINFFNSLAPPSAANLLGTDVLGRCVLSRIIHGSRIALQVGVISVLLSSSVGALIGLVAGFAEGAVQSVIMRITDAIMAIPPLILQLLISTILGMGVYGVVIAISITLFPGYIRLICGQVLSVKQNDYILAERSMNSSRARIMFKHLLPNCISPLIVQMTMMMGIAILSEAALSFLNLGIAPPTPAWGSMAFDGYQYLMTNPLLSIVPGFAIMVVVFSFNMVGDGLRDALDPRMRGTMN